MLNVKEFIPRVAGLAAAQARFETEYPAYRATSALDGLRAGEYQRLEAEGHVYLDYTGGGLYAASQVRAHHALLERHVFGNPHSQNPTSLAMTERIEAVRACVLDYFNASPDEYTLIFTPNASGAIKLVGEAYPFTPGGHFLLAADNHNSTNGVREFARARGAQVTYIPVTPPQLRLDPRALPGYLALGRPGADNLLAYLAQSNYSGVQHPLELIALAQARGWDVLLDAAAFVPTNRLDLSRWKPDFVPLSFYKIFGYPTGIGALIVRKRALAKLRRPWFAGGAITMVSVRAGKHRLWPTVTGFEDGTVNYLNIPAVRIGLEHIERIGLEVIQQRVRLLTEWLLENLLALRHSGGRPLVKIHGPQNMHCRGATLAMNFYDPGGRPWDVFAVEQLANAERISLRTGCFCNPGASEIAHDLPRDGLDAFIESEPLPIPPRLNDYMLARYGQPASATRVSLGLVTNFADVYAFYAFASSFLNRPAGAA
ncbi:MAG: aminotransferase class V-fold PLP-dependent enzyme [Anaerolineales bacterium]|nr:aminotransferase class V-fold PLP-dependent enzyme [Anaerolineales bacterium]